MSCDPMLNCVGAVYAGGGLSIVAATFFYRTTLLRGFCGLKEHSLSCYWGRNFVRIPFRPSRNFFLCRVAALKVDHPGIAYLGNLKINKTQQTLS